MILFWSTETSSFFLLQNMKGERKRGGKEPEPNCARTTYRPSHVCPIVWLNTWLVRCQSECRILPSCFSPGPASTSPLWLKFSLIWRASLCSLITGESVWMIQSQLKCLTGVSDARDAHFVSGLSARVCAYGDRERLALTVCWKGTRLMRARALLLTVAQLMGYSTISRGRPTAETHGKHNYKMANDILAIYRWKRPKKMS